MGPGLGGPPLQVSQIAMEKLPVGDSIDWLVSYLHENFRGVFRAAGSLVNEFVSLLGDALVATPVLVTIPVVALVAWRLADIKTAAFSVGALALIHNLLLWEPALRTTALVVTAGTIALAVGIPMGVLIAKSDGLERAVRPLLDFMQTLPSFVYLIPAVVLFGLGRTSGIIATIIFSTPPAVRLTNIGIRGVEPEVVEAANAFGTTAWRLLLKVQLPLARPTIMAGINQTVMLALSMSVIASMIGAGGLGGEVLRSIQRVDISHGVESGLGIVLVAMILDRVIQSRQQSIIKAPAQG